MSKPICCPKCQRKIPDIEVQHTAACPDCGVKLRVTGSGGLAALDLFLQFTVGLVCIALIASDHWVGWALAAVVFIGWFWLGNFFQREILALEIVEELDNLPTRSKDEKPATSVD